MPKCFLIPLLVMLCLSQAACLGRFLGFAVDPAGTTQAIADASIQSATGIQPFTAMDTAASIDQALARNPDAINADELSQLGKHYSEAGGVGSGLPQPHIPNKKFDPYGRHDHGNKPYGYLITLDDEGKAIKTEALGAELSGIEIQAESPNFFRPGRRSSQQWRFQSGSRVHQTMKRKENRAQQNSHMEFQKSHKAELNEIRNKLEKSAGFNNQ